MHDKSALYLPRQCLRNGGKSLDFIGFLGWKRRIYTLFTPLEDRSGIVEIIIDGKYDYEIKLVYDDQFADLQKLKKEKEAQSR